MGGKARGNQRTGTAKINNNSNSIGANCGTNNQNNRNNQNKNQKNHSRAGTANKNQVQKINNLQVAANAAGNKINTGSRRLENCLMNFKDPSIRRWLFKSSSSGDYNETRQQLHFDKHQQHKKSDTPARKRSSMARPVRVHDSCLQENGPFVINWNVEENVQNEEPSSEQQESRYSEDKIEDKTIQGEKKRYKNSLDHAIDDLVEIRVDEEVTTWPIRLRLGEFFELSLPKCHRRKRRRRHLMMIATMREKTMKSMMEAGGIRASRQQNTFKDTERLLKVLSINNVDQNSGHNAARCIVM